LKFTRFISFTKRVLRNQKMGWVVGGDFGSFVYELADDWYGFGFSHVAGVVGMHLCSCANW